MAVLKTLALLFRPPKKPRVHRARQFVDHPELKRIWISVRTEYFPDNPELDYYVVRWSTRRQKRTLASCNIVRHRVNVARELDHPACQQWLPALLYHEMVHAYLGRDIPRIRGKRRWHGREFRALERRHPGIKDLDAWIRSGGWLHAVRSERARNRKIR